MVLCVNLTHVRVVREEGTSIEKMPLWERTQHVVGGASQVWCPEFYKKACWASQGKQVRKQHLSMASALAPSSRIQPCLSSCSDLLQWGLWSRGKPNKPFSLQFAFWSWCFTTAIETLRQAGKALGCSVLCGLFPGNSEDSARALQWWGGLWSFRGKQRWKTIYVILGVCVWSAGTESWL